jgi:hypothetical protein
MNKLLAKHITPLDPTSTCFCFLYVSTFAW